MDDAAVTTVDEVVYPELDESGIVEHADDDVVTEPEEGQAEPKEESIEPTEEPTDEPKDEPTEEAKERQSHEENEKWKARRKAWEARNEKVSKETEKLGKILKPFGAKSYDELTTMTEAKIDDTTVKRLREEALDRGIDEDFYVKNYQLEQDLKLFRAQAAAQAAEAARKTAQTAKVQEDVAEFQSAYPNVDVSELMKNADFKDINEGVLGNRPLIECYERFQKYQGKITDVAKDKAAKLLANKMASAGSLKGNSSNADDGYYTVEQLKKMSPEQLDDNWEKVQKSYAKIYKK